MKLQHLMVIAGAAGGAALLLCAPAAHAQRRLPVGACVVADKRHPGRIVAVLPYGYSVKGFGANDTPIMVPFNDVVLGPCQGQTLAPQPRGMAGFPGRRPGGPPAAGGAMCFASDPAAGAGLEGQVRSILVRTFSHEPQLGEDGRITVHINSLRMGASRPASPVDAVQYQTVAGRTIYDVRVSFDTCTDYNRRVVLVRRDRNFVCFRRASGPLDCSMTANSAALAPDVKREVPK